MNGLWICFPDAQPGIVNDRVLVPARFISEALGAIVDWDSASRRVVVKTGERTIQLVIGRSEMVVNGTKIQLDVTPAIHFDRTYVPLRFVSEALGARVEWDASNYLVHVTIRN